MECSPRPQRWAGVRLSAVLPVFAEEESVPELCDALVELMGPALHEIVLVVAGSAPARTVEICAATAARIGCVRITRQRRNPGLGLGVRQGIEEASGTHVLLMDSDGEMDARTVPRMLDALLERDMDMCVGSRWIKGGGVEGYDPFKYLLNRGYQVLFRILLRTSVRDLTLGFKLAKIEVMRSLPWDSQFHDIGCETTMRVVRAGYRVTEVPTVWVKRKAGESSNPFRRNFKYVNKALGIVFGHARPEKSSTSTSTPTP